MPTHRKPHLWDRRQACSRLGRAHPWPGRIRTCWTTNKVSWRHRILQFPLTHRAWSHWNSYTLPQLLRMMSVMLAIGKETRDIANEISNTLMYIDLLKRKLARSRVTVKVWFR